MSGIQNFRAQKQNRHQRKYRRILDKNFKSCKKGICKKLAIPSKDQYCEPWSLKKEKRCKTKTYVMYSTI
jgi:hypothetical protein